MFCGELSLALLHSGPGVRAFWPPESLPDGEAPELPRICRSARLVVLNNGYADRQNQQEVGKNMFGSVLFLNTTLRKRRVEKHDISQNTFQKKRGLGP